jgi:heme/copper-type cytochrome/quinol oxidase subunit 4
MTIAAAMPTTRARSAPRGLIPASFVLGGTLLSLTGLTWDIQWHTDVGPDTFFTVPHLLLYSGSAIAGLASLVVVLMTTAAERRGREVDPIVGGRAVGVFGRTFAAPAGYLISGSGAASFLLYGLWDQWWHGLYGFDAVISSPPHIGLLLSITVTMVGAVMVFGAAREQRWGMVGAIVSAAVLLTFSMVTAVGLQALPSGTVNAVNVGVTFMSVLIVVMGSRLMDRRGGAIGVGLVVAAFQAVYWWFSPWAAAAYASATGLPVRDYVEGAPVLPSLIPMCLVVVAVIIEVTRRLPILLVGGVAGLIVAGCAPLQSAWTHGRSLPPTMTIIVTAVFGVVFGAVAAFLGKRFGEMLRQLAPMQEAHDA